MFAHRSLNVARAFSLSGSRSLVHPSFSSSLSANGILQPQVSWPLLASRSFSMSSVAKNEMKETSAMSPFAFLPSNKLEVKKGRGDRKKGLTEIRGSYYNPVTYTYLDELLSDWGGTYRLLLQDRILYILTHSSMPVNTIQNS